MRYQRFGCVFNGHHALARHFKHAQLVDRAEAVFHRAQQAILMLIIALKVQHHIHHVLQHARAGNRALLGHMPHQDDGAAVGLGIAHQYRRAFTHLADAARRAGKVRAVHGLDGVDHGEIRLDGIELFLNRIHGVFGQHQNLLVPHAQAVGAQANLPRAFFARYIQHALAHARHARAHLQQQRAFAHARLAAHQHQRALHNAAAQHTVKLADAGRLMRLRARLDLIDLLRLRAGAAALLLRLGRDGRSSLGRGFLQRIPAFAGRAFAIPARGFIPTSRADENSLWFGHCEGLLLQLCSYSPYPPLFPAVFTRSPAFFHCHPPRDWL